MPCIICAWPNHVALSLPPINSTHACPRSHRHRQAVLEVDGGKRPERAPTNSGELLRRKGPFYYGYACPSAPMFLVG